MKYALKHTAITVASVIFAVCLFSCDNYSDITSSSYLDPKNPVYINVWTYYNNEQLSAFESMVEEFNQTTGKERGIVVATKSKGSVADLQNTVMASAEDELSAEKLPEIFMSYSNTAYEVSKLGLTADINNYMTEAELEKYIPSYLEEGTLSDETLAIFPVAKSTEVLMLNKTIWDEFAEECNVSDELLATPEGITELSKLYYEWSDNKTPNMLNDGKAFFSGDSFSNFVIIAAKQLGVDLFEVNDDNTIINFDKEIMQKIWDNYYVPYISGYFYSNNTYCSENMKLGNIIAYTGSSAGSSYFPDEVVMNDTDTIEIESAVYEYPVFEGGENFAVQQGAGMVVTKTTTQKEYASVLFLKWMTENERNIKFSSQSGYLPVKKDANDLNMISQQLTENNADEITLQTFDVAINQINSYSLYTPQAFEHGAEARDLIETSLPQKAESDRQNVMEKLKSGLSLDEAVALYNTTENFNGWYNQTNEQLQALIES